MAYTWIYRVEKNDVWTYSDPFCVEDIDDTTFTIAAMYCTSSEDLQIRVNKGYLKLAKATVSLAFGSGEKETIRIYDWEYSCDDFKRIPIDQCEKSITCDIKNFEFTDCGPSLQFKNFNDYIMDTTFSDMTIHINDEEFPVHRIILAAQSPIFLKTFCTTDSEENPKNEIFHIDESISIDTLKEMLKYLYTGETSAKTDNNIALDLLAVAEKYEINRLKNLCENRLINNLAVGNVLCIFDAADKYEVPELRKKTIDFMVNNKSQIVTDPDFKKMCREKPELMFEFMVQAIGDTE